MQLWVMGAVGLKTVCDPVGCSYGYEAPSEGDEVLEDPDEVEEEEGEQEQQQEEAGGCTLGRSGPLAAMHASSGSPAAAPDWACHHSALDALLISGCRG